MGQIAATFDFQEANGEALIQAIGHSSEIFHKGTNGAQGYSWARNASIRSDTIRREALGLPPSNQVPGYPLLYVGEMRSQGYY